MDAGKIKSREDTRIQGSKRMREKTGKRMGKIMAMVTGAAVLLAGCGAAGSSLPKELPEEEIEKGAFSAGASLHDPFLIEGDDHTYYCYGTHMTAATTEDLRTFKMWADGVDEKNTIYDNLIQEPFDAFSFVGKNSDKWYSVWAPSVIYNRTTGEYLMYFCTTSSYIMSDLCYATSKTIDGPYHYQGTVIYSGFTKPNATKTNYYEINGEDKKLRERYITVAGFNNQYYPNAIDPAMFYDADGRMWMVYGSWSGGIFLLELDPETNEPIHPETDDANGVDHYYGKRLVGGFHHPIEGPYIQYDEKSGYYYLFLSYGNLQQMGGYQIRVFRSDKPDGTYVDASGHTLGIDDDLDHFEKYGTKLMGNYTLPSLAQTYMAPGGQSTFESDGKLFIIYHQRFKKMDEYHEPRVHQMAVNEEGWPCIFPFATNGETLSEKGYQKHDLDGTVYLLNHGLAVDAKVNEAVKCSFADGQITGDLTGTYEVKEGTNYADITVDGVTYHGVLIEMIDEAGNNTFCFSGIGENNQSLWGIKYIMKE